MARRSSKPGALAASAAATGSSELGHLAGHPVDADGSRDVFEVLRTQILEIEVDFVGDLFVYDLRDVDAAWLGERLDPRRDVDAVAEDVAVLGDDVAEIDPDPQRDALFAQAASGSFARPRRAAAAAQRVASTTLSNSMSASSPVYLKMFPPNSAICGSMISVRSASQPGKVLFLVAREQPAVAGYQDRRKPAPNALSRFLRHDAVHLFARCGRNSAAPVNVNQFTCDFSPPT